MKTAGKTFTVIMVLAGMGIAALMGGTAGQGAADESGRAEAVFGVL